MTPVIWDMLAGVVILICVFLAYRNGFLNTVVRLVGTLAAVLLSIAYSQPVASSLYHNYLEDKVLGVVAQNVDRFAEPGFEAFTEAVSDLIGQLPPFLSQALKLQSQTSAEQWYQSFLGTQGDALGATITNTIVSPVAISILQAIVFLLMFAVLSIAVSMLAKLLKGVNRIPIIGGVNALLGGLLGAAQGILFVFVAATILSFLMDATGDTLPFLSRKMVADTAFFHYFFFGGTGALW